MPLGSERYGRENVFAVIEFAKPEAAGLFLPLPFVPSAKKLAFGVKAVYNILLW